jgi:hypothetical protein
MEADHFDALLIANNNKESINCRYRFFSSFRFSCEWSYLMIDQCISLASCDAGSWAYTNAIFFDFVEQRGFGDQHGFSGL